jgi:hypothetical protein
MAAENNQAGVEMGPAEELAIVGPMLEVQVGFDPRFAPDAIHRVARPAIPLRTYLALIDTGCSHGTIDAALARELDLPVVGSTVCTGSQGRHEVQVCEGQVYLPAFDHTVFGQFGMTRLPAPERVILGRTFLRGWTLIYNGQIGSWRIMR